jgi:hypothetical protein
MKKLLRRIIFGTTNRPRRIRVGLLRGLNFEVDANSKTQRLLGLDEKEIDTYIKSIGAVARTAIDVGANDGWYTTYFASLPNVLKVVACDPDRPLLDSLARNLRLNNLEEKVEVHPIFVGSPQPQAQPTRTLQELLEHERPPFAIKIDVEGAELDVLKSGSAILAGQDCHLVIETHRADLERECIEYLSQLGYETTIIPNGWYRRFVPEQRPLAHNRWLAARKRTFAPQA